MRRKIPSTQSLACFEAAARHESYTRAAQELALTQSAVSRQIGALEDFMGLALFRRTRHGVQLTAAGADYARQISRQLDAMERDTLDAMARQGSGGALQLAAVPTFAGQRQRAVGRAVEPGAELGKLADRSGTLAHQHPHRVRRADAGAGNHGVGVVLVGRVTRAECGRGRTTFRTTPAAAPASAGR